MSKKHEKRPKFSQQDTLTHARRQGRAAHPSQKSPDVPCEDRLALPAVGNVIREIVQAIGEQRCIYNHRAASGLPDPRREQLHLIIVLSWST
jgi:hypothetical protein